MAQGGQGEVDEGGAALDVVRAGSVNAGALGPPGESVAAFLVLGKNGVEMGDERKSGGPGPMRTLEREVASVAGPGGLKKHRAETQGCEHAGGEFAQAVHSGGVFGEAVDRDHLPQDFQRFGKLFFAIRSEIHGFIGKRIFPTKAPRTPGGKPADFSVVLFRFPVLLLVIFVSLWFIQKRLPWFKDCAARQANDGAWRAGAGTLAQNTHYEQPHSADGPRSGSRRPRGL